MTLACQNQNELLGVEEPLDTIYAISGCTAVGKTELSLNWAEQNNAEIISCDSLLFYRGMDIGTAKPPQEELNRVPHHLVDIRDPSDQMDITSYLSLAIPTARDIQKRGRRVLVTGGSGFYLKAFFEPVTDDIEVSEEVRHRVEALFDRDGLKGCLAELQKYNPQGTGDLDTENPRRVLRALERCIASGRTIQELRDALRKNENALTMASKRLVVLSRDKEDLDERIRRRVDLMLEQGLIEETQRLRLAGFERNASAAGAIGYRETLAFLDGQIERDELLERIASNTRKLAKKQRTWFRTQIPQHEIVDLTGSQIQSSELFA